MICIYIQMHALISIQKYSSNYWIFINRARVSCGDGGDISAVLASKRIE